MGNRVGPTGVSVAVFVKAGKYGGPRSKVSERGRKQPFARGSVTNGIKCGTTQSSRSHPDNAFATCSHGHAFSATTILEEPRFAGLRLAVADMNTARRSRGNDGPYRASFFRRAGRLNRGTPRVASRTLRSRCSSALRASPPSGSSRGPGDAPVPARRRACCAA